MKKKYLTNAVLFHDKHPKLGKWRQGSFNVTLVIFEVEFSIDFITWDRGGLSY